MSFQDFGVIIACWKGDAHYALGCYASIRFFMPNTPVCFLYDGDLLPPVIAAIPEVQYITRLTVKNRHLKERSFGPGFTKMVAFFESPFETFLYLDADTTVCGDLRHLADFPTYDMIVDQRGFYSDESIEKWFFLPKKVSELCPTFDWAAHRNDYFCTGTFFAKRNALSLNRYLELLDVIDAHPGVFKFWEMGMLNLMIFEAKDQGTCRVKSLPYQLVTVDHAADELRQEFETWLEQPQRTAPPVVFHYPVTKPHLRQEGSYTQAMSHFRRQFVDIYQGSSVLAREMRLNVEDLRFHHLPDAQRWLRGLLYGVYRRTKLRSIVQRVRANS